MNEILVKNKQNEMDCLENKSIYKSLLYKYIKFVYNKIKNLGIGPNSQSPKIINYLFNKNNEQNKNNFIY